LDKSQTLLPLDSKYSLACIKYNKKYYYSSTVFKGQVNNEFNAFVERCKATYDRYSRKLLISREKIDLAIDDFIPELGYSIQEEHHYQLIFFITFCLGFGAYFEYYMKDKV
jgi:hypothetical protein